MSLTRSGSRCKRASRCLPVSGRRALPRVPALRVVDVLEAAVPAAWVLAEELEDVRAWTNGLRAVEVPDARTVFLPVEFIAGFVAVGVFLVGAVVVGDWPVSARLARGAAARPSTATHTPSVNSGGKATVIRTRELNLPLSLRQAVTQVQGGETAGAAAAGNEQNHVGPGLQLRLLLIIIVHRRHGMTIN